MVASLKSLHFKKGKPPAKHEQERVVQELATILEQARAIGQAHAAQETETRSLGMIWGGLSSPLTSARNIVSTFIERIVSWWQGQDDPEDITDQDIADMVETVAERVGGTEVSAEIESAVMATLQDQGVLQITWIAMPGACQLCLDNAAAGAIPIGTDFPSGDSIPPAHSHCRCSLGQP